MEAFETILEAMEKESQRNRLQEILSWVAVHYPELQPKIAWNQPMFTDHETFIIGFSTARAHIAVAPERAAIQQFTDAIQSAGYSQTRDLFRIRWEDEVDYELLGKLIEFQRREKADCTTFWRKA